MQRSHPYLFGSSLNWVAAMSGFINGLFLILSQTSGQEGHKRKLRELLPPKYVDQQITCGSTSPTPRNRHLFATPSVCRVPLHCPAARGPIESSIAQSMHSTGPAARDIDGQSTEHDSPRPGVRRRRKKRCRRKHAIWAISCRNFANIGMSCSRSCKKSSLGRMK